MPSRSSQQRQTDAVGRLASDPNVWIATASPLGIPHLVPLSLAWIDDRIVVSTPTDTPTVRNAVATGRVRAALDSAADVVVIDCEVREISLAEADAELLATYVARVGWDPRQEPGEWSLLLLTPMRVQAWNGVPEIEQRTIMKRGIWTHEETDL